jgi:hypothetical protein
MQRKNTSSSWQASQYDEQDEEDLLDGDDDDSFYDLPVSVMTCDSSQNTCQPSHASMIQKETFAASLGQESEKKQSHDPDGDFGSVNPDAHIKAGEMKIQRTRFDWSSESEQPNTEKIDKDETRYDKASDQVHVDKTKKHDKNSVNLPSLFRHQPIPSTQRAYCKRTTCCENRSYPNFQGDQGRRQKTYSKVSQFARNPYFQQSAPDLMPHYRKSRLPLILPPQPPVWPLPPLPTRRMHQHPSKAEDHLADSFWHASIQNSMDFFAAAHGVPPFFWPPLPNESTIPAYTFDETSTREESSDAQYKRSRLSIESILEAAVWN